MGVLRGRAPRPPGYSTLVADIRIGYAVGESFDWDPPKSDRNLRERGFGFDYAARVFAGRVVLVADKRRDYGEERIRAIGEIDGRVFVVVFTIRGSVLWIISAWKASGKDLRLWQNRA